jgi:hypothetical protein
VRKLKAVPSAVVMASSLLIAVHAEEAKPRPRPHAIEDHPVEKTGEALEAMERDSAPLIAASRAELPTVRKRFSRGLTPGETLYLTIRLPLEGGGFEQAFVAVRKWEGKRVTGRLASELDRIKEPRIGDTLVFDEEEVLDWTIIGRDDREEGNRLGHFMEGR